MWNTIITDIFQFFQIGWLDYFSDAFRLVKKKLTDKDKVVVYAPNYLRNLTRLVNEYSRSQQGNESVPIYKIHHCSYTKLIE